MDREQAWLQFTDGEYYNRVFALMASRMGEGDAENILANLWEEGFAAGQNCAAET